jgi:hypothetical protein
MMLLVESTQQPNSWAHHTHLEQRRQRTPLTVSHDKAYDVVCRVHIPPQQAGQVGVESSAQHDLNLIHDLCKSADAAERWC